MGRSSYTQSISTSTRTFQTKPTAEPAPAKPAKIKRELPKVALPVVKMPALSSSTVIIGALILLSLFLLVQYREAKAKLQTPQAAAAASTKQVNNTLDHLSKLVILPKDETPTVATVSDVARLKDQAFFANAKDGDKVIVYAKAKQAILYRPSTNQIVTIAPVTAPAAQ